MADWCSLPYDLLHLILLKLDDCEDFVFFSAVCRSWNQACCLLKPKWSPRLPWLLLAENSKDNPSCRRRLFNMSRNKSYQVKLPETFGARCCGSPYGWVVGIDLKRQLWLFNPLTNARIFLPPQTTMPNQMNEDHNLLTKLEYDKNIRLIFVAKAIIVKLGDDDFLVVAIYGADNDGFLAIARPGDEAWTPVNIDVGECDVRDIVGWDDQKIFVWFGNGFLGYCDVSGLVNKQSLVVLKYLDFKSPSAIVDRGGTTYYTIYIVKSNNDLLLALRYKETDGENFCWTTRFELFQLDVENREWKQINGLGSNTALFVGNNDSMSICTPAIGNCKPNCIYFTDDELEYWVCQGGRDMGVFHMETGKVEKFYEGDDTFSEFCPPLWFMPNI